MFKISQEKLEDNKKNLLEEYSLSRGGKELDFYSHLLPTHGTSFKNALGILKSDTLCSYRELQKKFPKVIANNLEVSTDILDKKLGLDAYAFFSMGRGTISEIVTHYMMFDNKISQKKGSLSSLLEIAELGSVVSEEARLEYGFSPDMTNDLNEKATGLFRGQLVCSKDFRDVCNAFYSNCYSDPIEYASSIEFPKQTPLHHEPFYKALVPRQGPQLMIPGSVKPSESLFALLDVYKKGDLVKMMKKKGIDPGKKIDLQDVLLQTFGKKGVDAMNVYGIFPTDKKMKYINTLIYFIGEMKATGNYGSDLQKSLISYMNELGIK